MVSANPATRRAIADVVEYLILVLDEMDGDPDFELEPIEEQHDREDDPAERAAMSFVVAEACRRKRVMVH